MVLIFQALIQLQTHLDVVHSARQQLAAMAGHSLVGSAT